jgi:CheY-like chemotaxis protein
LRHERETSLKENVNPVCILLVEDNQDDIELTQMALEPLPATHVYIVRDGEAALDFLFRRGDFASATERRPDLVLLDLHLPKCDGIEVLQEIRANEALASMPVVMLSASGRDEDIAAAYNSGCNTYVQKPVEFAEFQKALSLIRKYWGNLATLPAKSSLGTSDAE